MRIFEIWRERSCIEVCNIPGLTAMLIRNRTRSATVPSIVEKGLPSTRPAAKANALEALMLYIEVDKADLVIEEMIPFLSHKQPKVIAATLAASTQLYHAYGVKIIDPKPVLKAMPKLFGHADKNVRAEASNLVVELYRWLKEVIKPLFWNDLKPVQQQDLEKAFEPVRAEPTPKQQRLLRSQQNAPPPPAADGGEGDEEYGEDAPIEEELSFAEPVDVYSKIPKDFTERLASSKWKDRKDALDDLFTVTNTEKIQDAHFDEVVALLAKSMKDANIAVVIVAANNVECLAKGLRKSFTKYRQRIMTPMLERCKEKKQSVADALGAALDATFLSTSLSDCLEEILEFLKNKNPQVKLETLKFLIRCLKNTKEPPSQAETKLIADAATKLLTESTEVTRSGGAEILGTLMKITGERAMNPFLDGLDDIRKTKIKEYFEVAEVKAKNKPKPVAKPPPSAKKNPAPTMKKAPAGPAMKRPAAVEESTPVHTIKGLAKPGLTSKMAPPAKSGLAPPSGLRMQQKKLATLTPSASPARRVAPPPQAVEDEAPPLQLRQGLGGPRGLVGRTLNKPASFQSIEPRVAPPVASDVTSIDRIELEALRNEREGFMRDIADLRAEKKKQDGQIHDLRVQEAELIEERTRDRLTIRAKEQQVVRVRGEAESAIAELDQQKQQNERLRRELHRAIRPTSPAGDYIDPTAVNGTGTQPFSMASIDRYESNRASRAVGYQRARSYMTSPSEEKENGSLDITKSGKPSTRISRESRPGSEVSSQGPRSPSSSGLRNGDSLTSEPIENWKRAAEVTSALRAKIDQLKVCFFYHFVDVMAC